MTGPTEKRIGVCNLCEAICGLELTIERVEAKAKLSQNRSTEDQAGVVAGLRNEGGPREAVVADRMDRLPESG